MAIKYDKTYRAIHMNIDANVLAAIDEYKSTARPRTKLFHDALEMYIIHLQATNVIKSAWSTRQ